MPDKRYSRDKTPTPTTPIPTLISAGSRRSATPIKSPSIKSSSVNSPSPRISTSIEREDCDQGHSHKRCSCFRRPKPPPELDIISPGRPRMQKKLSTASMASCSSNRSSPSLPSTPEKTRNGRGKASNFEDSFSTTSTTPAGPPPSSGASMTPAGPPPSYLGSSMIPQPQFGSSRTEGSGKSLQFGTPVGQTPQLPTLKPGDYTPAYNKQFHDIFSSPSAKRYNQQKMESGNGPRNRSGLSKNIPALKPDEYFQLPVERDEDEMDEGDETFDMHDGEDSQAPEDYQDDSIDGPMPDIRESMMAGEDLIVEGEYDETDEFAELARMEEDAKRAVEEDEDSDLLLPTPKRPRAGRMVSVSFRDTMKDTEEDLEYQAIARDIYKKTASTSIRESDELLLRTEELVMKVFDEGLRRDENEEVLDRTINACSAELIILWDHYDQVTAPSNTDVYDLGIGPDPSHSPFANANFLANLLLQLHKPAIPIQHTLTFPQMPFRSSHQSPSAQKNKPIPATLLDWINKSHNPIPDLLKDLSRYQPAPSASRTFWKDIHSGLLRGKMAEVAKILRDAGWEHARENGKDRLSGSTSTGLSGQALANTERVISELLTVLEEFCPAIRGDWNNQSSDWKLFRLRIENALNRLNEFAEGKNRGNEDMYSSNDPSSFTLQSRKAESKVPWPILQNMKVLYGIISGDPKTIIDASADWCEATVGLVAWWDESKYGHRVVLGQSRFGGDDGQENYLRKLKRSVKRATRRGSPFSLNSANPIEIGLVCIFRGDVEAAIGMIRTWSLPLAAAVAEIAALGRWLPRTEPRSLLNMGILDLQDLELLGVTGPNDRNDGIKDNTLNAYASALAKYDRPLEFDSGRGMIVHESWELAMAVLGRLDDPTRREESVGLLLELIPIKNIKTLDKIIGLLHRIGLTHHAEKQAEKYANTVAGNTQDFGEALRYYALAHKPKKVKEVLDHLTSYCLVESRSFPTFDDLDPFLKLLIADKTAALEGLEKMDMEASQLLQRYLTGYAVLRQFYDARDEKNGKGQGVRNRAALQGVINLIHSSAKNIRGGVYDESCDSVVSLEFLLVLLGEVLPFISQPGTQSIITVRHIEVLLRAIEDLQTVSSRVYSACDQFFMTVLASARGLKGSTPSDLLVQSAASGLGQSQFSLVGSTMAASQYRKRMGSSGVLAGKGDVKRAWDWRKGLSSTTTSAELLGVLRLGLAKDLARCWIEEADASF